MMEMIDVKKYRRSLLVRYIVKAIGVSGCVLLALWGRFHGNQNDAECLLAIAITLFTAVGVKLIFLPENVSFWACMKEDHAVERAWYEEHDELRWRMRAKAGIPIIPVTALVLELLFLCLKLFGHSKAYTGIMVCAVFVGVSHLVYHIQVLKRTLDAAQEDDEDEF